jgi:demethylmenaquinone methyltransferase/2-methoxy-6-polyprenyl-1,4-benzoquinol methylase
MGLLQRSDAANRWFSFIAPGYDAVVSSFFWPDSLQRKGLELLEVEPDDRVLDAGCGTGETTKHLLARAGAVYGVDLSPDQLATAVRKDELAEAEFLAADALSLPFPDDVFDRVVSVGSIMYWEDPGAVLREARRVTRPGGSILVMGFNRRNAPPLAPIRNVHDAVNSLLFYRYGPAEATGLFERSGWRDVENRVTGPNWSPSLVIATAARNPA